MSTDAVMSTVRDSGEDREGEMMAIEKKSSNVSTPSLRTSESTAQEAESREDSGTSLDAQSEPNEERQGDTKTMTTSKAAQKKNTKGRQPQLRQHPQDANAGHYQQQRGSMAYRAQMQVAIHASGNGQQPRGPYGNPAYGYGGAGGPHESFRATPHHPQYSMPPLPHHPNQQSYGAPPSAPFHHGPNYGSGPYGPPPPPPPPPHHMYPYHGGSIQHQPQQYQPRVPNPSSSEDTASIGSTRSKGSKSSNSRKKRTIDGVDPMLNVGAPPQGMTSAFTFRRTHSSASTSSTVTTGNNTSTETPILTEDSPQKTRNHLPPLSSRPEYQGSMNDDAQQKQSYHRRNFSGASTTSSLSVGGLSLSSYETRGSKDDVPLVRNSPKRRRGEDGPSQDHHKISTREDDKDSRENLFLTLSTSPINSDVEATPVSKNTKKTPAKLSAVEDKMAVQELQAAMSMESISKAMDRNSDTPTPPVPSSSAESDMITDEHLLNRHLRGQTFTPLPHIGQFIESREGATSPPGITANPSFSTIGGQLSWDITGDAPSLGEIGDWEEDPKSAQRPGSVASQASGGAAFAQWKEGEMVPSSHYPSNVEGRDYHSVLRLSVLSPHSDVEMEENAGSSATGGTTPIPFYDHQRENGQLQTSSSSSSQKHGSNAKPVPIHSGQSQFGDPEHIHQLFVTNGGRGTDPKAVNHSTPIGWNSAPKGHPSANYMRYPPAPVYTSSDQSPMNGERGFFPNAANNLLGLHQANDRIRNLRGRGPPGGQRMPMTHHQFPPHLMPSYSHNLTSPIGAPPSNKGATWSPHALPSPHQDSNSGSKRKCVPMKPPIPTKFQGDMEKFKNAHVPEFANLVNFPSAMSQSKHAAANQLPEGMKCCVMCGSTCPCSLGGKTSKKARAKPMEGSLAARNGNVQKAVKEQQIAIIPTQNKGLCTLCDVNVWIVAATGLEIKWCKGCKNFRPWAAFGDKGLATKCLRCRDRQREKYAIQKEEKERMRLIKKAHKASMK